MPWSRDNPQEFILVDADEMGPWCRDMREVHDVTSRDVGEAIGMAHNQVCAYERGAIQPGLANSIKLAHGHGYEVVLRKKRGGSGG